MGTRNLTMVIDKEGDLKVAQYGQWDGYPEGQGTTILNFCKNTINLEKLEKALPDCRFFNRCDDIKQYLEDYDNRCPNWQNKKTTDDRTEKDIYWFDRTQTRDLGGKILESIITLNKSFLPEEHKGKIYLFDDHEFGRDSIMCEWAYCINFQTKKLECFCGFNKDKEREHERFKATEEELKQQEECFKERKYYGIWLVKEYDLYNLPEKKEFVEELEELTKGEEDE